MDERVISKVVEEVLSRIGGQLPAASNGATGSGKFGVYDRMEDAVEAAYASFEKLRAKGIAGRRRAIELFRSIMTANAQEWGRIELEETKIGRLDHKIEKLIACAQAVPGVEFLERRVHSGDLGIAVDDFAPWGVIGSITPVTHSVPTLTCNAINMVAAGNAVVYNTHPGGAQVAALAIKTYNEAIYRELGISDLLTTVSKPTLETFDTMVKHKLVSLLCVTGGPAVVKAAMASGKRAVCAGPGNPPVVVDETADLDRAADCLIKGAAYDNNLLCIGEKEVFVVSSVADGLIAALKRHGAVQLDAPQIDALTNAVFSVKPGEGGGCATASLKKEFIGQDPAVLAKAAGTTVPAGTELLFGEVPNADHLFVQKEQMMPFLPIVRVRDVHEAIDLAIQAEHGYKHTAIMHSRNVDHLTKMAQLVDTTLFVKNGPCTAALGGGGEGYSSYSIATPTGEGITTPMTFTRFRRCTMSESLNLY